MASSNKATSGECNCCCVSCKIFNGANWKPYDGRHIQNKPSNQVSLLRVR